MNDAAIMILVKTWSRTMEYVFTRSLFIRRNYGEFVDMNLRKQCWCHRLAAIFVSDASATGYIKFHASRQVERESEIT